MTDNFPPDAAPEHKGMPRSFFVDPSKFVPMGEIRFPDAAPDGVKIIPLEISDEQSRAIEVSSRTYGG